MVVPGHRWQVDSEAPIPAWWLLLYKAVQYTSALTLHVSPHRLEFFLDYLFCQIPHDTVLFYHRANPDSKSKSLQFKAHAIPPPSKYFLINICWSCWCRICGRGRLTVLTKTLCPDKMVTSLALGPLWESYPWVTSPWCRLEVRDPCPCRAQQMGWTLLPKMKLEKATASTLQWLWRGYCRNGGCPVASLHDRDLRQIPSNSQ